MTARLDLPQSARFGSDTFLVGKAHHYSVRGSVESSTAEGATARSRYTCLLSRTGDRWHLDRLTLSPS